MATQQATALPDLLGKTVTILESLYGVQIERTGKVIGIVKALPGTRCSEAFMLDQEDGDCCYYDPLDVTIISVE